MFCEQVRFFHPTSYYRVKIRDEANSRGHAKEKKRKRKKEMISLMADNS